MTDPEDFLTTPVDDLPDELQLPAGHWLVRGRAITRKDEAAIVTIEPIEARDDVDPDELAAWESERDEDPVAFVRLRGNSRAQLAQFKRLCRDLGLPNIKAIIGEEFVAELKYDPNKNDPGRPWPRWVGFTSTDSVAGLLE